MSQPDRFAPAGGLSRNTVIVGSVVLFHVAAIWALQSGLVRKAAEVIVPAELLSEFIAPPAPKVAPAAQATRAHTRPSQRRRCKRPSPPRRPCPWPSTTPRPRPTRPPG
jgi:protein TonB